MKKTHNIIIGVLLAFISIGLTGCGSSKEDLIDNSETEIGIIYQEYDNNDIVEILMISYDGQQKALEQYNWKNPVLEMLNNEIKLSSDGPVQIYQAYRDEFIGNSIEIRSYPFVDEDYIQIVTSCVVFPSLQPDLYDRMWSYNFDKKENKIIELDDALGDYNLTQDEISRLFTEQYTDEETKLVSVEVVGFVIHNMPGKPVTNFLLEVMRENYSDPYKDFAMYAPDYDEFIWLAPDCLFDPDVYDMPQLDPLLAYNRADLRWPIDGESEESASEESDYILAADITGFDELSPGSEYMLDGLLYVSLQSFPVLNDEMYDEASMTERIKLLKGDDIRISSLALSDDYTAQLTYPTWLIVYETGQNEDTAQCADLYFQTYTGEHWVHTVTAANFIEDYQDKVTALLTSTMLTTPGDSVDDINTTLVQNALEKQEHEASVIVMTGEETINGEHCCTYSAGDYSADGAKYTAMYHYAVSDSQAVYYMDIIEGPDWLPLESD